MPRSPRLSQDLTEEQYERLVKLVPWGVRRALFSHVVDDVIDALDEMSRRERHILYARLRRKEEGFSDFILIQPNTDDGEY